MKMRKWSSIFLLFCILASLLVPAGAKAPEEPLTMPDSASEEPLTMPESEDTPLTSPEGEDAPLTMPGEDAPAEEEPKAPEKELLQGFQIQVFPPESDIFNSHIGAALLYEMNTDTVLYALNPYERKYPASLTKVMTCLLALERGKLNDVITVSESAVTGLMEAASVSGLEAGEEITLHDLLYCVMLESANEGCNVVAEYISGSVEEFVKLMNERAIELGCTGTHFANPHGLHDEDHYSTAYDLMLITREAWKNPTFREIVSTPYYTLPATNKHEERKISTTNQLLVNAPGSYYYSKAAGVKTGFTTPAGRCLISTADNGTLNLLAVILQAETKENESQGIWEQRSFPECINLFEYGFDHFKIATVTSTLYPIAEVKVLQSAGAETVALAPTTNVRTIIDADYDPKEIILDISLPSSTVEAPVQAGDILGHARVLYRNMVLGEVDLAAIANVARSEIRNSADKSKAAISHNWWKWLVGILVAAIILLIAYVVFLQVERRQERKRKIAARRRALEQQRRKQQIQDVNRDE